MEVVVVASAEALASVAADLVASQVASDPRSRLGFATGATPLPTYRELARRCAAGSAPAFGEVQAFLLDEYVGLLPGDPRAFETFVAREVVEPLGISPRHLHTPDLGDLSAAGHAYEQRIAASGGVDLQLLGIGSNGHLAFNEPGSSFASTTRVVSLSARTREDNARFFASIDEVPTRALTQGLATILRSRHALLLATGAAKAEAVAAAVARPPARSCPASVLQLHPRATILLDAAAASLLPRRHVAATSLPSR